MDASPDGLARAIVGAAAGELAMPRAMAARLVRNLLPDRSVAAPPASNICLELLSKREREVLALVARDDTDRQIAHRLPLSPRTVEHYVASILRKLEDQTARRAG